MSTQPAPWITHQQGYSYVEILLATILIAISLIPASEALHTAMAGARVSESYSVQHYHLVAKMEEVLADSYLNLETEATAVGSATVATAYSDAPASTDRRVVFLSAYDADDADGDNDPFTGTDPGILWVRVELEGTVQSFESLTEF